MVHAALHQLQPMNMDFNRIIAVELCEGIGNRCIIGPQAASEPDEFPYATGFCVRQPRIKSGRITRADELHKPLRQVIGRADPRIPRTDPGDVGLIGFGGLGLRSSRFWTHQRPRRLLRRPQPEWCGGQRWWRHITLRRSRPFVDQAIHQPPQTGIAAGKAMLRVEFAQHAKIAGALCSPQLANYGQKGHGMRDLTTTAPHGRLLEIDIVAHRAPVHLELATDRADGSIQRMALVDFGQLLLALHRWVCPPHLRLERRRRRGRRVALACAGLFSGRAERRCVVQARCHLDFTLLVAAGEVVCLPSITNDPCRSRLDSTDHPSI
jgi:hypothetical protein